MDKSRCRIRMICMSSCISMTALWHSANYRPHCHWTSLSFLSLQNAFYIDYYTHATTFSRISILNEDSNSD